MRLGIVRASGMVPPLPLAKRIEPYTTIYGYTVSYAVCTAGDSIDDLLDICARTDCPLVIYDGDPPTLLVYDDQLEA